MNTEKTQYQIEREKQAGEVMDVCQKIETELKARGEAFSMKPDGESEQTEKENMLINWGAQFQHEDGRNFRVRLGKSYDAAERGKVVVTTGYSPKYTRADGTTQSIYSRDVNMQDVTVRVSLSRGIPAVVKDILNRFMPTYTELYKAQSALAAERQRRENAQRDNWSLLCKELRADSEKRTSLYVSDAFGAYLKDPSSDSVNLDFGSVPYDVARKLLAVAKELYKAGKEQVAQA